MAKIQAQLTGGSIKEVIANTVGDVKRQLGVPTYTAHVNGNPAADSHQLKDFEFVTLTESVKAGGGDRIQTRHVPMSWSQSVIDVLRHGLI